MNETNFRISWAKGFDTTKWCKTGPFNFVVWRNDIDNRPSRCFLVVWRDIFYAADKLYGNQLNACSLNQCMLVFAMSTVLAPYCLQKAMDRPIMDRPYTHC